MRVTYLRACDDGFAAHGAEAGEEACEEGAQAWNGRGHDRVKDFCLAADGGDDVERLVAGVEFLSDVVDVQAGDCDDSGGIVSKRDV